MVAWLVWCRRNKIRCNEPSLPTDKILEAAGNMLVEFQQKPRVQNLQNQQWSRANPRVRWSPPGPNVVRVNSDGAMFKESNEAGIGIVVRNQDGRVMAAMAEKIHQPASVETLEFLAARRAMLFAAELGFWQSIFEGDSEVTIRALQEGNSAISSVGYIEKDINV